MGDLDLLGNYLSLLDRLTVQLLFALRTHPLEANTLSPPANRRSFRSVRIKHAYYCVRHSVRFLFVSIPRLVNRELGLGRPRAQQALHGLIAEGPLLSHQR